MNQARSRIAHAVLAFIISLVSISFVNSVARADISLKDIKDREVVLERPAARLLIDDGRYLVALALIHQDPASILAAWPRDINRVGEATYARYARAFPKLEELAVIPSSAGTFDTESVIAAQPDVAVFSLGAGPDEAQLAQLEAAGIKVVFIDFFTNPGRNLEPSLALLGQITGREQQAQDFITFRREHMARIAEAVGDPADAERPRVFLEAHAGISEDCCNSPGKGNVGDYITFTGGHNIGADILPRAFGRLSLEYILTANPDIYIATGGPHLARTGGLVLGEGYDEATARAALERMAERPGIAGLKAVQDGRVHGLSHQLLNSPLDILAIEALARWISPDRTTNIDPAVTLREINDRFLAVPLQGTHWIDLR